MSPTIEGHQDVPVKTEGEERLEGFKGLLGQIEERANRVVAEKDGVVDGEAVKFGKAGFRNEIMEIGRIARQASIMLDHAAFSPAINPFKVNGGPHEITLGRMATIGTDDEFNRLFEMGDTTELTAFLQNFFDSAKSITAKFEAFDKANQGELSAAIVKGEGK
ncbi:MAG: hypothetical protein WCG97_03370 [bacterium]